MRRLGAGEALKHGWFSEAPVAVKTEDMPTFPSMHEVLSTSTSCSMSSMHEVLVEGPWPESVLTISPHAMPAIPCRVSSLLPYMPCPPQALFLSLVAPPRVPRAGASPSLQQH